MVSRVQGRKAVASTAFKTALPRTLPVCVTFFLLALSYGVLMGTRGFSFLWPMCMSAFIFTGSMEFVTVNLLVSAFNPFATFMLAVMLGTRHLFYGISMLGRFKNMGVKNRISSSPCVMRLSSSTTALSFPKASTEAGSTSSWDSSTNSPGWLVPRLEAFSADVSRSIPPDSILL